MLHIETELESYSYRPLLKSGTIHVTDARWGLCSIGIVPEGSDGRQVDRGPLIPGPWGFATVHPGVIDNHGGSGREMSQAIKIRLGEPLTVQGLPGVWTFAERDQRRLQGDGVRLIPHGADPSTVGFYANPSDAGEEPERFWLLDSPNPDNRLSEVADAMRCPAVGLVDEEAGGVIAYIDARCASDVLACLRSGLN